MVLTAKHISLTLGQKMNVALNDISLSLEQEEAGLLTGPSGSGKTAMGITLCGLLPHWTGSYSLQGTIEILGKPVEQGEWNSDLGIILENPQTQFSGLKSTVEQELAFPLECMGVNPSEIPPVIERYAEMFEVVNLLPRRAHTLSGGELQRVMTACAPVSEPRFIFMDRPLTEFDFDFRTKFFDIIRTHAAMCGGAALIAEDPWLLSDASFDRVFRMEPGGRNLSTENTKKSGEKKYTIKESIKRNKPKGGLLQVEELEFGYYADTPIIENLSFSIGSGDTAFITGPNGAGKSTLAKLLTGILRPWKGDILLEDTPHSSMKQREIMSHVGYAFQNAGLHLSRSSVQEELASASSWGHAPGQLTEILELGRLADKHPLELTQGERKHLALALAGGGGRRVVILDEPTQYQDEEGFRRTTEAIRHLSGRGTATLLISHDPRLYLEFPAAGEIALKR